MRVTSPQTVLETELRVSYNIHNFDPSRFQDIHLLLYSGSALLYAVRLAGEDSTLTLPCGVITMGGRHSITVTYNNHTNIATTEFMVFMACTLHAAHCTLHTARCTLQCNPHRDFTDLQ